MPATSQAPNAGAHAAQFWLRTGVTAPLRWPGLWRRTEKHPAARMIVGAAELRVAAAADIAFGAPTPAARQRQPASDGESHHEPLHSGKHSDVVHDALPLAQKAMYLDIHAAVEFVGLDIQICWTLGPWCLTHRGDTNKPSTQNSQPSNGLPRSIVMH